MKFQAKDINEAPNFILLNGKYHFIHCVQSAILIFSKHFKTQLCQVFRGDSVITVR